MARNRRSTHAALYGVVKMQRDYCSDCDGWAFVIHGQMACCGADSIGNPKHVLRMSQSEAKRARPGVRERQEIFQKQVGRCLYCEMDFGSIVWKRGKAIVQQVQWDHLVPWCYSLNNQGTNFAAACQLCNRIKSDKMFDTVEEAREYIRRRREKAGITSTEPDVYAVR